MESIDKEDDGIEIDTSKLDLLSTEWTDEKSQEATGYVDSMLEETLRSKYAAIDLSQYDFKLKLQPLNYELEHAYVIPVLTRDAVARDPSLLQLYQQLDESIIANASSYDEVKNQVEELIEKAGNSRQTFTLVVDVSIECLEDFAVTEKDSGQVVAGQVADQEQQTVLHLVRFEMLITKIHTLGSWIISDWDDMLDGNVWHLMKKSDKEEEQEDEVTTTTRKDDESSS
jgi:hypothetical protein